MRKIMHISLDGYAAGPNGEMLIFGSPRTVHFLAQQGLVDEDQRYLSPVLLGAGILMFEGFNSKLKLLTRRIFEAGVVGLCCATISR